MALSTDTWQEWQTEYRFGVVLIFPPEPILSLVNGLRRRYDPRSQETCDAHVSLTVPAPRPITEEARRDLEAVTMRRAPLWIRYGPPAVHPAHPGVTLQIGPEEALRGLVADLEAAPPFRGAGARRWPFSPHMTIAEFVTREESAGILEDLPSRGLVGAFTCTYLSVAVPDDAFHFTERCRLPLGGPPGGAAS